MFTEKTKLVEKRENPFYGSYKENNILEEIHWQNKRKKQQLAMISAVVLILVLLSIGITLAITLPPILDRQGDNVLNPENPENLPSPSSSVLRQFAEAGVSSESDVCSNLGRDILQTKNGSAVDAAIAMTLCSGVTNPQSSGLGGGLFMVIYTGNETYTVNARETAPINVDPMVYENDPMASLKGGLAVGVPGEFAGLWEAHQKFGKVQWSELVQPSRELAQNGFSVSTTLAKSLEEYKDKIKSDPILRSEFVNQTTGEVWLENDTMKRTRLATTLLQLEQNGLEIFYNGTLAQNIVADIANAKGIITATDLSSYSVEWDTPFEYELTGNLTMYSLSFPSSGPVVALGLGILHGYGRKHPKDLNTKEIGLDEHQLVETMKFAHAHRALVADPNYANTTEWMDQLLSMDYANELRAKIDAYKTFDDPSHYGAVYTQPSDAGTTHISIIGRDGDAVSLTTTINMGFGAGFMGDLSGIIFNNQMNDFSIGNSSDIYGLSPNELNSIEPGKRPASSMAPLILVNSLGQPVLATGGSGGEKVISAVISTTWRALYRDSDIKTAIDYPRFMPTFNPSELLYEYGIPKSLVGELERRGHRMRRIDNETLVDSYLGNVNAVCRTKQTGVILANADYRKMGDSAGF